MNKEILTLLDVKVLVNSFYDKVKTDELLAPIFNNVIKDNWPMHLDKMYRFWQTVLLEEHTYYGSPFPPHAKLPIEKKHFDKWLTLFETTIHELFSGAVAEDAIWRSRRMAELFLSKMQL
jgi:hemoglobin